MHTEKIKGQKAMKHCVYESPLGAFVLCAEGEFLVGVSWSIDHVLKESSLTLAEENPVLALAHAQMQEYFSGMRQTFDLPIKLHGTAFQKKVWQALSTIPFGRTFSYSNVAAQIQSPKACRAVGLANARNKLAIVIPCHRVIGKDGSLTGFAGGLDLKSQLLAFEQKR